MGWAPTAFVYIDDVPGSNNAAACILDRYILWVGRISLSLATFKEDNATKLIFTGYTRTAQSTIIQRRAITSLI